MTAFCASRAPSRTSRQASASRKTTSPKPSASARWIENCGNGDAMTEAEWLRCEDPELMLKYLQKKATEWKLRQRRDRLKELQKMATERKLWLFAACCCRSIWRTLKRRRSRIAVEAIERFADGLIDSEEL